MKLYNIANLRLISQQIARHTLKTPKNVVAWMGAMQAQDFAMVKWAIGVRLAHASDQEVETAINNAEILRTHLLRPTWHLVSADDIYWMLELTAAQIKATMKSRLLELGLSEEIIAKSNKIIENALSGGKYLTRQALVAEFEMSGIATGENRASHLLARAELDGLVCNGSIQAGRLTYALLEERIPKTKHLTRDEALGKLAKRYFTSRGPATLQDFAWWSGLAIGEAKRAFDMVKADFIAETIDDLAYWFSEPSSLPKTEAETAFLLPAYDEFLISYKDRTASLPLQDYNKTVSSNGIFRPIIVENGQVIGIWNRSIKKETIKITTQFFKQPESITNTSIEKAFAEYRYFLTKKIT
jgi:hypothetical protein